MKKKASRQPPSTSVKKVAKKKASSKPYTPPSKQSYIPGPQPVLTGILAKGTSDIITRGEVAILYGQPGIGKSTLAAYAPTPCFIPHKKEQGVMELKAKGLIPASIHIQPPYKSFTELIDTLSAISNDDHPFRTVVIDGLKRLDQEVLAETARNAPDDSGWYKDNEVQWEKFNRFQAGPEAARDSYMQILIDAMDQILDRNINILLVGHSQLINFDPPQGTPYIRYIPEMNKRTYATLSEWATHILFYTREVPTKRDGYIAKSKVDADKTVLRYIEQNWSPAYDAKSKGLGEYSIEITDDAAQAWQDLNKHLKWR